MTHDHEVIGSPKNQDKFSKIMDLMGMESAEGIRDDRKLMGFSEAPSVKLL